MVEQESGSACGSSTSKSDARCADADIDELRFRGDVDIESSHSCRERETPWLVMTAEVATVDLRRFGSGRLSKSSEDDDDER